MADKKMFHEFGDVPEHPSPSPAAAVAEAADPELERYSRFFSDLDSYTEYWDLYRPELRGKYMRYVGVVFNGVLREWFEYAVKEKTAAAQQLWATLTQHVAAAPTAEALRELDDLQRRLLEQHFPAADGRIDSESYLKAVEAFARDVLPPDADRLSRTPEDDSRHDYAGRHRMDGPSMWFSWAGVADCVTLLPAEATPAPHHALLVGAAAFGSAMDFTFRGQAGVRGKTRPEYRPDEATATRLRNDVRVWIQTQEAARAQATELYRIFSTP
jgi:hypothetical protein